VCCAGLPSGVYTPRGRVDSARSCGQSPRIRRFSDTLQEVRCVPTVPVVTEMTPPLQTPDDYNSDSAESLQEIPVSHPNMGSRAGQHAHSNATSAINNNHRDAPSSRSRKKTKSVPEEQVDADSMSGLIVENELNKRSKRRKKRKFLKNHEQEDGEGDTAHENRSYDRETSHDSSVREKVNAEQLTASAKNSNAMTQVHEIPPLDLSAFHESDEENERRRRRTKEKLTDEDSCV
jgi:hypothetical protein